MVKRTSRLLAASAVVSALLLLGPPPPGARGQEQPPPGITSIIHTPGGGVFVGTPEGVARSPDGGPEWANLDQSPPGVLALQASGQGNEIHTMSREGVFVSGDDGRSWFKYGNGAAGLRNVTAVAFAPGNPAEAWAACVDDRDGGVFGGGRVLHTTDAGNRWSAVGRLPRGVIVPTLAAAVARPEPGAPQQDASGSRPPILFAGTLSVGRGFAGVLRSLDGGRSWSPASSGIGRNAVQALATDPRDPRVVVASIRQRGVFSSHDGADTWVSTGTALPDDTRAVAIGWEDPPTLWAGTAAGNLVSVSPGPRRQPPPTTRYTAPLPPPERPEGADYAYFPQTGHYVRFAFLDFFKSRGGVGIFGYPRTEEMDENGKTVQYFQRARFEFVKEKKEVVLGLVGEEIIAARPPYPRALPFVSSPERWYFAATRHSVSFGFLDFYRQHGGLEVFGYPISEEVMEGKTRVQYFQRARLELHPELPSGQQVVMGLVGEDLLRAKGWLDAPDREYFSQTGQWVSGAFLKLYRERGGADIFGYPRTGEMDEQGTTVQYFQRARFEYHPEDGGSVRLTPLGEWLLRGSEGARVPPRPSTKTAVYFEKTGHVVSGGFLERFHRGGGEAVFGLPISEEIPAPGGGTMQWFQMARMHFIPGQGVTLALLGDEVLRERLWIR